MPATESVNLFESLASSSAILMGDALDGVPFYLGLGLTILLCGAILKVLTSIFKGRRKKYIIKYKRT